MGWYSGPTLCEAFDSFKQPKRPILEPLRFAVRQVYKIGGVGTVVAGRVLTGVLKKKATFQLAPKGIRSCFMSIEMYQQEVPQAISGDNVGFRVQGFNMRSIRRGVVFGDADNDPPIAAESFVADLIIMNHPGKIVRGYTPVVDIHTAHVACMFEELLAKIDRKSKQKTEDFPKFLKSGDAGKVRLVPIKPLVVETFATYPALGRFVVRDIKRLSLLE